MDFNRLLIILVCTVWLGACTSEQKTSEDGPGDEDPPAGDSAGGDPLLGDPAGDPTSGDSPGDDEGTLALNFVTPVGPGTVYTNGVLSVDVDASGDQPSTVELLLDGTLLTTLSAPFTFDWNTATVSEGAQTLQALANTGVADIATSLLNIEVDRMAPTIVARSPTPNATNVAAESFLLVEFSESLLAASLLPGDVITLLNGLSTPSTATLISSDTELMVQINTTPLPRSNITITVPATLTDPAGNPLAVSTWQWSIPVWFALPSSPSTTAPLDDSDSSFDSNDNLFAAWSEEDGTTAHVRTAVWDGVAESWLALGGNIGFNPGRTTLLGAQSPCFIAQSPGSHLVAWQESRAGSWDVFAARFDGTDWNLLGAELDGNVASDAKAPSAVLDSSDRPVIAWAEGGSVHVKRWDPIGTNWLALGASFPQTTGATLITDAAGDPVLAALDQNGTHDTIMVWRWNESGTQWDALGAG